MTLEKTREELIADREDMLADIEKETKPVFRWVDHRPICVSDADKLLAWLISLSNDCPEGNHCSEIDD